MEEEDEAEEKPSSAGLRVRGNASKPPNSFDDEFPFREAPGRRLEVVDVILGGAMRASSLLRILWEYSSMTADEKEDSPPPLPAPATSKDPPLALRPSTSNTSKNWTKKSPTENV